MTNCTKCTKKPIVKEYLCDSYYETHNAWLRNDPVADSDGYYTVYERGVKNDS